MTSKATVLGQLFELLISYPDRIVPIYYTLLHSDLVLQRTLQCASLTLSRSCLDMRDCSCIPAVICKAFHTHAHATVAALLCPEC